MQFCWVTLQVRDMERSLHFYRDILGLPLNRRFSPMPSDEIAFLGSGETKVELICNTNRPLAESNPSAQHISIGFRATSLESMMDALRAQNIPILAGPFQPNPSIRFFYVLDPDGFKVQIVEEH